jgi:hypothetical protein
MKPFKPLIKSLLKSLTPEEKTKKTSLKNLRTSHTQMDSNPLKDWTLTKPTNPQRPLKLRTSLKKLKSLEPKLKMIAPKKTNYKPRKLGKCFSNTPKKPTNKLTLIPPKTPSKTPKKSEPEPVPMKNTLKISLPAMTKKALPLPKKLMPFSDSLKMSKPFNLDSMHRPTPKLSPN